MFNAFSVNHKLHSPLHTVELKILEMIFTVSADANAAQQQPGVATSGPTIWTSTYGLEPGLYNRLLIELSGWAQTVHMFTQRFT